ncbi:MAG: hypothetical protein FWD81_03190 [Methanomassiliicoccaceae archaeon]|nr:hypothetical protein [Methanomassiliicoccaceae archaeon]
MAAKNTLAVGIVGLLVISAVVLAIAASGNDSENVYEIPFNDGLIEITVEDGGQGTVISVTVVDEDMLDSDVQFLWKLRVMDENGEFGDPYLRVWGEEIDFVVEEGNVYRLTLTNVTDGGSTVYIIDATNMTVSYGDALPIEPG